MQVTDLQKKMAAYCAYRERCAKEVHEKLLQLGANPSQTKKILTWLEKEKYFDNSRFAINFARGKFNNNQWGKHRITMELKAREISNLDIEQALKEIEISDYQNTLEKLAKRKWLEIKEPDVYHKKQKIISYLINKGYEMDLAWTEGEKLLKQEQSEKC